MALGVGAFYPQRFGEGHELGLVDMWAHSWGQISQRATTCDETFLEEICDSSLFDAWACGGPL